MTVVYMSQRKPRLGPKFMRTEVAESTDNDNRVYVQGNPGGNGTIATVNKDGTWSKRAVVPAAMRVEAAARVVCKVARPCSVGLCGSGDRQRRSGTVVTTTSDGREAGTGGVSKEKGAYIGFIGNSIFISSKTRAAYWRGRNTNGQKPHAFGGGEVGVYRRYQDRPFVLRSVQHV